MTLSVLFQVLGGLSLVTFVGSLVAIPWLIGRLPQDYFVRHRQEVEERHRRHPVSALIVLILRNTVGLLLLVTGLLMLVLPGQGILTMVIGISFMDFPGKRQFVDSLLCKPRVMKVLNWIREKEKRKPFEF